jgi:hypothetical protein
MPTLSAPSVVKSDAFPKNAHLRGLYPLTLPSDDSQVANSTGLRVCIKTVLDKVNNELKCVKNYIPWTCELADQALAGAQIGDYPTTRNTLQDVLGVPRNQVAVVNDVLLTLLKLFWVSVTCPYGDKKIGSRLSE